jgi:3-keto-5-aminohexanoate cleavage enzyme
MDPLVITATPNICWLHPEVEYPRTTGEIVEEAQRCQEAGASILHIHAEDRWTEVIAALRSGTNLIVQCGMSSFVIPRRMEVFEQHADMISIILSHHDEAFAQLDMHVLHPREELEEYARLSRKYGVKLEHEIWHTGSIWNLKYLIDKGLLDAPHITTLFFDWPGGSWTPATIEEYQYRRRFMPPGCVVTVSAMQERQIDILAAAILHGDHIRVGTEDYPFVRSGRLAATHELVAEAVQLAKALGRQIATPDQARQLTGL